MPARDPRHGGPGGPLGPEDAAPDVDRVPPAIVLLAGGSIGFRGLVAMAAGDVAMGEQQLVETFVVELTIAAGRVVGNTTVRPKASP